LYSTETNKNIRDDWEHGVYYVFTSSGELLREFARSDVVGDLADQVYLIRIDLDRVELPEEAMPHHFKPTRRIEPVNVEILFEGEGWRRLSSLSRREVSSREDERSVWGEEGLVDNLAEEFREHKCDPIQSEFEGFLALDGCGVPDERGRRDI